MPKMLDQLRVPVYEYKRVFPEKTIREIARDLEISRSTVQRIFSPPAPRKRLEIGRRMRQRQLHELFDRQAAEIKEYKQQQAASWRALLARHNQEHDALLNSFKV